MRPFSETRAITKLHRLQDEFTRRIRENFEHRAQDCATCPTPGACCLDAHFVNVRITRLEAVAICQVIDELPSERRAKVMSRIDDAVADHDLSAGAELYACPLFNKGSGCLVHDRAKPLPCIAHACYENKEDLPPDELLSDVEGRVARLNELVYRKPASQLPIPTAISSLIAAGEYHRLRHSSSDEGRDPDTG